MITDRESLEIKKSMAYDIIGIIESDTKGNYTPEEIKSLIKAYISDSAK